MTRKWSNLNLPGALHFVTGNFLDRTPVFSELAQVINSCQKRGQAALPDLRDC